MATNLPTQSAQAPASQAQPNKERVFEKPVAWLLGRQLLKSLKGTFLYVAYGRKLDPRHWMQASVFPNPDIAEALKFWRDTPASKTLDEGATQSDAQTDEQYWEDRKEFWFDYIADTGDGTKAVYSIAYLAMSDLWAKQKWTALPEQEAEREVKFNRDEEGDFLTELPRGQFLVVGGDTAYHVSDYMTLAKRLQLPFKWACEDLKKPADEPRRPVFGIPGNHDYYDQLDGFRRQFRHPIQEDPINACELPKSLNAPQLVIPGFYRAQEASYIALQLPFKWWFWGLDTEVGQIDERQEKFFNDLCPNKRADGRSIPPDKLIVATCSPTTVFGKIASKDDEKAADALFQIGLEQSFLPKDEKRPDGTYDFSASGDAKLDSQQCLLEISGDVHHYARYWGPKSDQRTRAHAKAEAPVGESYASVVSGIGGAFHHPSTTYVDEVREQVLYPTEDRSRVEVAKRVFKVKTILGGGNVGLAGFIIAFILYFAAALPQSSRESLNPPLSRLGLAQRASDPLTPTVLPSKDPTAPNTSTGQASTDASTDFIKPFWLWRKFGAQERRLPAMTEQRNYLSVYEISPKEWSWDYHLGLWLLLGSLVPILLSFLFSKRLFGAEEKESSLGTDVKPSVEESVGGEKRIRPAKYDPEVHAEPDKWLWLIVALTAVIAVIGLLSVKPYRSHIPPFNISLLIFFSIIWAIAAGLLGIRYSEHLFKKAAREYIKPTDWALPSLLSVLSVLSVVAGLWAFGRDNLPALVVSDIVFIIVAVGLPVALILLAALKGGETHRWPGKLAMALVGIWHALLQIAVPFLLVKQGTLLTLLAVVVFVYLFRKAGEGLMSSTNRLLYSWGLLAVWIFFGAVILWVAYSFHPPLSSVYTGDGLLLPNGELAQWWPAYASCWTNYGGWMEVMVALAAGGIGSLMCCVWFGWYLAVCLGFNGHNNEIGGAARIEDFKQFIRFRLTNEGLTGYVIAVDDVSRIGNPVDKGSTEMKDGSYLEPYLIDVFSLKLKP